MENFQKNRFNAENLELLDLVENKDKYNKNNPNKFNEKLTFSNTSKKNFSSYKPFLNNTSLIAPNIYPNNKNEKINLNSENIIKSKENESIDSIDKTKEDNKKIEDPDHIFFQSIETENKGEELSDLDNNDLEDYVKEDFDNDFKNIFIGQLKGEEEVKMRKFIKNKKLKRIMRGCVLIRENSNSKHKRDETYLGKFKVFLEKGWDKEK